MVVTERSKLGVIAEMEEDILQETLCTIAIQIWLHQDAIESSRRLDDGVDIVESFQ